jgi:hypothetical protein
MPSVRAEPRSGSADTWRVQTDPEAEPRELEVNRRENRAFRRDPQATS